MRTNIEIDDELMRKAMSASGAVTKKDAVAAGLQLLVQIQGQTRLRELRGKVAWRGPDDDWFASDEAILDKRRNESSAGSSVRHSALEGVDGPALTGKTEVL